MSKSTVAIARARATFKREHCLLVPGFLSAEFLKLVQDEVGRLKFRRQVHAGFGRDLKLPRNNASGALIFMLNDIGLFRAVESLTTCGRIRGLSGSIRRATAGAGNVLSWHDDNSESRRVAMTINISAKPYGGGFLQIREKRGKRIVKEIANTGPGDAVLFRVSPRLEHRNTEIIGKTPKTAFSGWFQGRTSFDRIEHKLATSHDTPPRFAEPRRVASSSRIVASTGTVTKELNDLTILLNLRTGGSYRLNDTGAQIFALLKRANTPRRIASTIAARYGVARQDVERDCAQLYEDLANHNLIEIIS